LVGRVCPDSGEATRQKFQCRRLRQV
jgi:hypothetical protein